MLADYLESVGQFEGRGVPKNKFDLQLWMATYNKFERKFKIKADPNKDTFVHKTKKFNGITYNIAHPVECQTAGCAVGWATSMPEFNKLGLYLDAFEHSPIYFDKNDKCTYYSTTAVCAFFHIDGVIFCELFLKKFYTEKQSRDPVAVAQRIREVVNNYLIAKTTLTT